MVSSLLTTVVFNPMVANASTSASVVKVNNDEIVECDEYFFAHISTNDSAANLLVRSIKITIKDDDDSE